MKEVALKSWPEVNVFVEKIVIIFFINSLHEPSI